MSQKISSITPPGCQTFDGGIVPGTSQKLAFTGTSAQSSALGANTTVVQLIATAACFVAFGASPTAVADTSMYIPANVPILVGVTPATKIAAIQSSGGGNLFITEGA